MRKTYYKMSRLRCTLFFCLVISLIGRSHQQSATPSPEEPNPLFEAAKSFLSDALEQNPEYKSNPAIAAISGLLQTAKDSKNGQPLSDILSNLNIPGGSNVASDILSGLASVMSKNGQGFDPQLVGQVADVLSSLAGKSSENDIPGSSSSVDWGSLLGLASNILASTGGDKNTGSSLEGLMNLLPLLTNSPTGHVHFADNELEDASEHKKYEKSSYQQPPFMYLLYEYWEHFKRSEFGDAIWRKSGLESIFQLFIDENGYFQVDRIFESMENASFRKRWIRSLSSFVGEWYNHFSDPVTQARYMENFKLIGNNILKSQGYSVYFDPSKPTDSTSVIIDAVLKRHFGLKVNAGKYIRPAVLYIKEVFKFGESKGIISFSQLSSYDISNKLSEVLNGDIIEPVLRVWRAYKYSLKQPQCDKLLVCYLNKESEVTKKNGLKPGVTRLSSLIASYYMSGRTGTPFWKLYNAATEDHLCEVKYAANCQQFFDEDSKFTTESALHGEEL